PLARAGDARVPELVVPVLAPALDGSVGEERADEVVAAGDLGDAAQARHLDRRGRARYVELGRAECRLGRPELTDLIEAPALDGAARDERAGREPGGGDRRGVGDARDGDRRGRARVV